MNIDFKKIGLIAVYTLVVFSVARFIGPKNVETKEVEKVVYKDRVIKDEEKEIHVETRETTLPDGTKIKESIRDRKTQTQTDTSRDSSSETIKESKTSNQSSWSVGLYTNKEFLAGTIDRRILGGLFLGVFSRTNIPLGRPEFGVGARVEF